MHNEILIVYYSLYGDVFKLAQAVKEGVEAIKGAEVLFRRVEEFDIVLKKTADDKYLSQVPEQQKDIPVCTLDDLRAADGVLIGSSTRLRQYDRPNEATDRFDRKPLAQGRDGRQNRRACLLALLRPMVGRKPLLSR
jgi:hypothetical protein